MTVDVFKDERQFHCLSFSDIDCIKGLIKFRSKIDKHYMIKRNDNINLAGDTTSFNPEIISIYQDLDNLIRQSDMTPKQQYVITRLMQGYSETDIANEFNNHTGVISGILNTICNKIKKTNDRLHKYNYIYMNLIKSPWVYKRCSRCFKFMPRIDEFFGPNASSSDRFHSICKKCDSLRKRQ